MHRLLAFAVVFFCAQNALALRCGRPDPSWWPTAATLPPLPYIVLDKERLVTAWFEGPERVDASIEVVGDYQVIRPKTPLTVGATYTLKGANEKRFAQGVWQRVAGKQVPLTWTIAAASAAPSWTGDISVGAGSAHKDAWGIISQQALSLAWTGPSLALAEVKLTRGATAVTLMLPIAPGKPLGFGRDLCGGEVRLEGEGEWTAKVTLIGPSGQRSKTKSVTFPSPVPR